MDRDGRTPSHEEEEGHDHRAVGGPAGKGPDRKTRPRVRSATGYPRDRRVRHEPRDADTASPSEATVERSEVGVWQRKRGGAGTAAPRFSRISSSCSWGRWASRNRPSGTSLAATSTASV